MSPRTERSALKRAQPGSPDQSPSELKKPRRSNRLRGAAEPEDTVTPAAVAAPAAESSELPDATEAATEAPTEVAPSPAPAAKNGANQNAPENGGPSTPVRQILESKNLINTPEVEKTPDSQPYEPTQVASQFYCPPLPEEEEDGAQDPDVWGCLVPINTTDPEKKVIKLNKNPDCTPCEEKDKKGRKKKKGPSGFLVGRHPECDLRINEPVISNRHCVIYKENMKNKPRAILEDLSANGTWVNGVVVGRNNRRELKSGDEIEFAGGEQYVFRYPKNMISSKFHEMYEIGRPLGSGHFATVYTAIERSTGIAYAVKIFKKRRQDESVQNSALQQEIAVLMSVSHPNVLCLKGSYDEDEGVYLVLELAPEGELFNYIIANQKLSEEDTRKIFIQLFKGLKYLHDRNIVHRDIKPENILLVDKELHVKLADFGLAKIIGEDSFTTSLCGTPSYVAPEVLQPTSHRQYDRAVDIWSLGVVLYICLCGFPPFSDELNTPERPFTLQQQIQRGMYDFPSPYWDSVQDSALDLIERMLDVNPQTRITVEKALEHPWIKDTPFNPAASVNSFSSITDGIQNMGFVRRQVTMQRTLLADAPGLRDSILGRVIADRRREDGDKGKEAVPRSAEKGEKTELDPHTTAFVNIGGKAGDETLYGSSFDSMAGNAGSKGSEK